MRPSRVPLRRIEKGELLAEMIDWYRSSCRPARARTFQERFDRLWKSMHQEFKKRKITSKDIERAVAEVRASYR